MKKEISAIKAFRLKKEIRQNKFANASGISKTYYNLLENGKIEISPKMQERILKGWKKMGFRAGSSLFQ